MLTPLFLLHLTQGTMLGVGLAGAALSGHTSPPDLDVAGAKAIRGIPVTPAS